MQAQPLAAMQVLSLELNSTHACALTITNELNCGDLTQSEGGELLISSTLPEPPTLKGDQTWISVSVGSKWPAE